VLVAELRGKKCFKMFSKKSIFRGLCFSKHIQNNDQQLCNDFTSKPSTTPAFEFQSLVHDSMLGK
jgi:hypothetical protein